MKPHIDKVGTVLVAHDFSKDQSEIWIPGWQFSHPAKPHMSVSFHASTPSVANLIITGNGPSDTCKDITDRLKLSYLDTGFHIHSDGSGGDGYLLQELQAISLAGGINIISTLPSHINVGQPYPIQPIPTDEKVASKAPRRKFGWPPVQS